MPEGDSVHRHAARLAPLLVGEEVEQVLRRGLPQPALAGAVVLSVEARGKHLLVTTDRRAVLHVHLGINGGWRVLERAAAGAEVARADLALLTASRALLARARTVEILQQAFARAHPRLRALGPDLLGAEPDWAEVVRRARARGERPVGELLLDQTVAAGIGNIWRNEALFREGLHPDTPLSALDDAALERLYRTALALLRRGLAGRGPKAVYRRRGQPCAACGAPIEGRQTGEQLRQIFWCPRCQRVRLRRTPLRGGDGSR
jgi:endonuclease-8